MKKSNNKIDNTSKQLKFSSIDLKSYNPLLNEERLNKANGYVSWGIYNDYPEYLYDIYSNCATLQSIISGSVNYTLGNNIINNTSFTGENRLGETFEDVIAKLILDRWIFGGYCFQVLYNTFGKVTEICYLDIRKVRTDEYADTIWVYDNWVGYGTNRAKKFNAYNPKTGAEDGIQIYYYKGNKTRGVYPVCDYYAALVSAETQIEIQKFHYNELINNFMGSAIINFNNGQPEQEQKEQIERGLIDKFTGTENTARLFVSYNEDKDKAITIERLSTDDLDDRYNSISATTRENLFISMNAHPQLFGQSTQTGFADIEYSEAFNLYSKTQVLPKQKEIIRVMNKVFGMQTNELGEDIDSIQFIPYTLNNNDINE